MKKQNQNKMTALSLSLAEMRKTGKKNARGCEIAYLYINEKTDQGE